MELSPTPLRQNKCDKECDESHIPNRFLLLLLSSKAKAKLIWPKSCFRFRFCSYSARFFPTARNVLCPKFLATIWAVQFVPSIYRPMTAMTAELITGGYFCWTQRLVQCHLYFQTPSFAQSLCTDSGWQKEAFSAFEREKHHIARKKKLKQFWTNSNPAGRQRRRARINHGGGDFQKEGCLYPRSRAPQRSDEKKIEIFRPGPTKLSQRAKVDFFSSWKVGFFL